MKIVPFAFVLAAALFAAAGEKTAAQTLSGTLDTKLSLGAGAGGAPDFFYGAEEYANLRLKIPVGELASVYGAVNLIAASGTYGAAIASVGAAGAPGGGSGVSAAGENYAALMELERLYVQISADSLGLSAGLMRIPFGYGIAWGPMDFLNPRNPLEPDARLRGVVGITGRWYPAFADDMKFLAFAAAPRDPLAADGGGARFGLAWESHWDRASVQALYVFESPAVYTVPVVATAGGAAGLRAEYPRGIHRAGLSFKIELELGFQGEILYTVDPVSPPDFPDGLAASFGADYTLFDGKLYLLAEYLYSGAESTGAYGAASPTGRAGAHYLYGAGTWKWSDFASITAGCAANLEDLSATALAAWEYQFAQGLTVSLKVYVPLDSESFGGEGSGELGPRQSKSYIYGAAGLRVKF